MDEGPGPLHAEGVVQAGVGDGVAAPGAAEASAAATWRTPARTLALAISRGGLAMAARRWSLIRATGLLTAIVLSFWAGMGPRWDYPYSYHVDEWKHQGMVNSLLAEGALVYPNPNPHPHRIGEVRYHREMGFHLLFGFLHTITGVSVADLYRLAPAVQMALLAMMVYALGARSGYGWTAALLVPLIPTSTRTLGPELAAPVSLALLLIPVTLLVVHRMDARGRGESLWLLTVLIGGTLFVHPTTEAVVTGFTALALGLALVQAVAAREFRGAASLAVGIGVRLAVPAAVLAVWLPGTTSAIAQQALVGEVGGIAASLGFNQGFFGAFGAPGVLVFIVGLVLFTMRARYGIMSYVLPITTVLLALFLLWLYPRYTIGPAPIYERGWLFLGLFMVILAGYGAGMYFRAIPAMTRALAGGLPAGRRAWVSAPLAAIGVAALGLALLTGLTGDDRFRYTLQYRMVTEPMVADMAWIGSHRPDDANRVFMEPSLSFTFPPLAGVGNVPWRSSVTPETDWVIQKAWQMLGSGELDMDFIPRQGIYLIYTCLPGAGRCTELKAGLPEVRHGVYWLPEWRRWRELP